MSTRISQNLRHLRISRERTRVWVADQIGRSSTIISNYEAGKALPPITILEKYAEVFEVDLGHLVSRDLWLGENSQLVEDPGVPYGGQRLKREKEALHGMLDAKEEQIKEVKAQLITLAKRLKSEPGASEHFETLSAVLAILEKG